LFLNNLNNTNMSSLSPVSGSPSLLPCEQIICSTSISSQSILNKMVFNAENRTETSPVHLDINSIVETKEQHNSKQPFQSSTYDNSFENYMFRSSPKRKRPDGITFSKKSNAALISSNVNVEIQNGELSLNSNTESGISNNLHCDAYQGKKDPQKRIVKMLSFGDVINDDDILRFPSTTPKSLPYIGSGSVSNPFCTSPVFKAEPTFEQEEKNQETQFEQSNRMAPKSRTKSNQKSSLGIDLLGSPAPSRHRNLKQQQTIQSHLPSIATSLSKEYVSNSTDTKRRVMPLTLPPELQSDSNEKLSPSTLAIDLEDDHSGVAGPMSGLSVGKRRARTSPLSIGNEPSNPAASACGLLLQQSSNSRSRPSSRLAEPFASPLSIGGSRRGLSFGQAPSTVFAPIQYQSLKSQQFSSEPRPSGLMPTSYQLHRNTQREDNSQDELTLKDLGTPVTEVGSPAVIEDMMYGCYNGVDEEEDGYHSYDLSRRGAYMYNDAMSPPLSFSFARPGLSAFGSSDNESEDSAARRNSLVVDNSLNSSSDTELLHNSNGSSWNRYNIFAQRIMSSEAPSQPTNQPTNKSGDNEGLEDTSSNAKDALLTMNDAPSSPVKRRPSAQLKNSYPVNSSDELNIRDRKEVEPIDAFAWKQYRNENKNNFRDSMHQSGTVFLNSRDCCTPLFAHIGDEFSSNPVTCDSLEGVRIASDSNSSAAVAASTTAACNINSSMFGANTTTGSISLSASLSLDDSLNSARKRRSCNTNAQQHATNRSRSMCTDYSDSSSTQFEDFDGVTDSGPLSGDSNDLNSRRDDTSNKFLQSSMYATSTYACDSTLCGTAVEVTKSSTAHSLNAARINAVNRPLPDQSAFDRNVILGGGVGNVAVPLGPKHLLNGPFSPPPVCPPTPARTPSWGAQHLQKSLSSIQHLQMDDEDLLISLKQERSQSLMLAGVPSSATVNTTAATSSFSDLKDGDGGLLLSSVNSSSFVPSRHHHNRNSGRGGGFMPPAAGIVRQSSLGQNKVLLISSDTEDEVAASGEELFHQSNTHHSQSHQTDVSFGRDFENLGILGSGTFGDVFKARSLLPSDVGQQKCYAVKKSRKQFRSKRDREWLLNEVRTMKMLGHSHRKSSNSNSHHCEYIVQFIRAWQEDSYFYVQLDLVEKGTLKDLINDLVVAQRTVPEDALWHIMHDVASGLEHIHSCGMVHLDIKPANLLISASGVVKIGDFGMAAAVGSKEDGHEGDTRYMAMELLNNCERLPSADMFSFGLTIYEVAYSEQQLSSRLISLPSQGPLWHTLRSGTAPVLIHRSAALAQLVAACMLAEPEKRPTAAGMLLVNEVASVCSAADRESGIAAADVTLLSARTVAPSGRAMLRPNSFHPIFCEGSSLSIDTSGTLGGQDDDDRAFTPHF